MREGKDERRDENGGREGERGGRDRVGEGQGGREREGAKWGGEPVRTFYPGRRPSVITPFLVGKSSSYLVYRVLTLRRHTGAKDQNS